MINDEEKEAVKIEWKKFLSEFTRKSHIFLHALEYIIISKELVKMEWREERRRVSANEE